eukprot:GAFH01001302.1.p1 GENE.GAFH01001302.1~~GAFH01001302.1.p1  ORF type:complete len:542 (-),score=169.03 GAFH01001302.1:110-1507(-)
MNVANQQRIWDVLGVDKTGFGWVITVGFIVYGVFVVINGILVDKMGGRKATIIGAMGSAIVNVFMGIYALFMPFKGFANIIIICLLYAINNYFQTFCTSAICKVGVNFYNFRERGFFSGIFGVIIAFGFFLAFDVNDSIINVLHWSFLFFIPAVMMFGFAAACYFYIRSTPEDAGFSPVDEESIAAANATAATATEDPTAPLNAPAGSVEMPKKQPKKTQDYGLPFMQLVRKVFFNPIFILFCVIDFCVGWCRDGILSWFPSFLHDYLNIDKDSDFYHIASAGVTLGGMFGSLGAGMISDLVFGSRRPPVAFIALIGFAGCVILIYFAGHIQWLAAFGVGLSSFFFSSVHGIITSTCAMDFAGSKATGTAVGLLDGVQKIGSSLTGVAMAAIIGGQKPGNYGAWALSMIPGAAIGAILVLFIINRKPPGAEKKAPAAAGYTPVPASENADTSINNFQGTSPAAAE